MTVLPVATAWAQSKGDRIPGFVGLQVGTQPPPGIYTSYLLWAYPTDTIKSASGDDVPVAAGLTSVLHAALISWVAPYTVAGGHFGAMAGIPFIRNRIQLNSLDIDVDTGLAFTDTILTPASLGWHRTHADFLAAYNLYLPTGEFEPGGRGNSGLGMIGQELSFGSTAFVDANKRWHVAGNVAYEWHTKKNDLDLRVGQIVTVEYGAGRTFHKKVNNPLPLITNIGLVGYGQFKVTEDRGSAVLPLVLGEKDRVYGLGGEVNVFIPQAKLTVMGRVIPEFGARLRTQGTTITVSVAYVAKSLVTAP